jgi:hypothetical protein
MSGPGPDHPRSGWRVVVQPARNAAGTALAWLLIERPSGEITIDHKLMVGSRGRRFIQSNRPDFDLDGHPRLIRGRPMWRQWQMFREEAVALSFKRQVLTVLRAEHPELFVGEPEP